MKNKINVILENNLEWNSHFYDNDKVIVTVKRPFFLPIYLWVLKTMIKKIIG